MKYKFICIVNFFIFIICTNIYAGVLNNDSYALAFIMNELDVRNFSKKDLKNVKKLITYRNAAVTASNLMHQHVSQTSSTQHQHNAKYYSYRCKTLGNQNDLIQKLVLTWAYMQYFNSKNNTNKNTMISKFDVQEVLKSILQRIITTIEMQSKKHLKKPICLTNVCISESLTKYPHKKTKKRTSTYKKTLFRCIRERCVISEIQNLCNNIFDKSDLSYSELEFIFARTQIESVKYNNSEAYIEISQVANNRNVFKNPWCL